MKPINDPLQRLLRAAAKVESAGPAVLSSTRKAAVLARWRAGLAQGCWFESIVLLRRGVGVACVTAVLLATFSFLQIKPPALDAWDYAGILANTLYEP